MYSTKLQNSDHFACPCLLAQTTDQTFPEAVVNRWPAAHLSALFQRFRSRHCARLMLQHIQIMLQVEQLLIFVVAPFVTAHALVVMPEFDKARVDPGLDGFPHLGSDRIRIRPYAHATR